MCGIAGVFVNPSSDVAALDAIDDISATLAHRGPDEGASWIDRDAGIALGHRRLAVIDLSPRGRQPMASPSGRYMITFNGEIYNFQELRAEMEQRGAVFRGHGDTEVLLAACEMYGVEAAVPKLVGMFAMGIWDRKQRSLHLVRDRLGKKPLFIGLLRDALVFASELRAICATPSFRAEIDPMALNRMLQQGWVPEDLCIWKNVVKAPAGTITTICESDLAGLTTSSLRARAHAYWSLAEVTERALRDKIDCSPTELERQVHDLLAQAVRQRMCADVPLGVFLSGGVDSAIVAALMQAQSSKPIRTFTIGFGEAHFDEAIDAARVARQIGAEHTEFRLTARHALDIVPELPRIWDEPFSDESQIPSALLARMARSAVKVVLTGDGGDECFGGYSRHFLQPYISRALRVPAPIRRAAAATLVRMSSTRWDAGLERFGVPTALRRKIKRENLHKLAQILNARGEADLYDCLVTKAYEMTPGDRSAARDDQPWLVDGVSRLMYRDMAEYLPGDILVKLDRATMAVGLEARSPLLDHRLVEFAWRIPVAANVRKGEGKSLLRQVLRRYLPNESLHGKHGFDVPTGAWMRGPLRDWVEDHLGGALARHANLFDGAEVRACWQEHVSGRRDRARQMWALMMALSWLEAWTGASAAPAVSATKPVDLRSPTIAWGAAPG